MTKPKDKKWRPKSEKNLNIGIPPDLQHLTQLIMKIETMFVLLVTKYIKILNVLTIFDETYIKKYYNKNLTIFSSTWQE